MKRRKCDKVRRTFIDNLKVKNAKGNKKNENTEGNNKVDRARERREGGKEIRR